MIDEFTTSRDIASGLVHAYRDVRGLNNDAIVHWEIDNALEWIAGDEDRVIELIATFSQIVVAGAEQFGRVVDKIAEVSGYTPSSEGTVRELADAAIIGAYRFNVPGDANG